MQEPGIAVPESRYPGYREFFITGNSLAFALTDNEGTWDNNNGENYHIAVAGEYTLANGVLTPGEPELSITVHYRTDWSSAFIQYAANQSAQWTTPPGVEMVPSSLGEGYFSATISGYHLEFALTNGNEDWDSNQGTNYTIASPGEFVLENGVITQIDQPAFDGSPYLEQSGTVVFEAEDFHANELGELAQWTTGDLMEGYAGSGYMQALPDARVKLSVNELSQSPRLDYRVQFSNTGLYYLWIRSKSPSMFADSVHVGLDGEAVFSADRVRLSRYVYGWQSHTLDINRAVLSIDSVGEHKLSVWMREDGSVVDKIILTQDPDFVPTGSGPATSFTTTNLPSAGVSPAPVESSVGNVPDEPIDLGEPAVPVEPSEPLVETFQASGSVSFWGSDYYGPYPAKGGSEFSVVMTGTNDADLYVRFGAEPSLWRYHCRPYQEGSDERCDLTVPEQGRDVYIRVHGYEASEYQLEGSYTPAQP